MQKQRTRTQNRKGQGGFDENQGSPQNNQGYGKLAMNTQASQQAHHGRVDSNTGLLNRNPNERDAWLDSELLSGRNTPDDYNGNIGGFSGNPGGDMNTSQLQIKSRDPRNQPMGAASGTGGGGPGSNRPPSALKKNASLRNQHSQGSHRANKVVPINNNIYQSRQQNGNEDDFEQEMDNIINDYDQTSNNQQNQQNFYQPQNYMGSGNLNVSGKQSANNGSYGNHNQGINSATLGRKYQNGPNGGQSIMNGPGGRQQYQNSGMNTLIPGTGVLTLNYGSNVDMTNPILENIEQSFAQSRSNIASMIQQYGQDADPLPDVEDILEEEDNIKEASQFRSRDIIMRQRSGHQQNKYRTLTTMIRDPDADLLENETEAQIMKIKRFCRKLCRCCEKKDQLDDSFNYTSGDSDMDCQEMFLAMDEDEQQNRILELWQRTLAKARGAVKVIEIFGDLNRRIYLYGSDKKHDYLYEQDKLKPLPFILFPQSRPKNFWNVVMMMLVIYTGTYIPYKTAFIEDSSDLVNNIELGIDSLFIVDVIVNFISAYEDSEKNVEFRFMKIARQYIMGWFILDLVSCIPFQYLDFSSGSDNGDYTASYVDTTGQNSTLRMLESGFPFGGATFRLLQTVASQTLPTTTSSTTQSNKKSLNYSKLLKLTRLPRLYKLLRILRLFKMMRLLKYNRNIKKLFDQLKLNPGYMKMITVTVTVLFLVHLVSCFYFMVASFTDFDPDSWVVKKNLLDSSNFAQYITAMYWAFQTLTTVGYGDVQGATTFERVYCLLWMIFGVAFYSFTIGNLQSIISTIDVKASELSAKLNTLTGFAKRTKLPDNIVLKIKRFLENNNANSIALSDSRQMLNELPSTLRAEVVKQTYADIIEKVKFFNKKDSDFLWAFLPALKPMKVYSKDILYSQGDHPEEVFFIQKGRVKLCYDIAEGESQVPINIPFNMYVEGSYFGDLEILIKRYRKLGRDGTAIVDSECHLLVIGAKELKAILKYFKEIETQMIHTAQKRRRHHQKQIQEAKKRYIDKKVKALKNAQIFQNKNALNQFSNWKKKSKKTDNFIKRAKASRKKLEMIASHKNGVVQSDGDESGGGGGDDQENQSNIPSQIDGVQISRKGSALTKKNTNARSTRGGKAGAASKKQTMRKQESVSDYDDSGNDDDEDDEEDSDLEDKKLQSQSQTNPDLLTNNNQQSNSIIDDKSSAYQQSVGGVSSLMPGDGKIRGLMRGVRNPVTGGRGSSNISKAVNNMYKSMNVASDDELLGADNDKQQQLDHQQSVARSDFTKTHIIDKDRLSVSKSNNGISDRVANSKESAIDSNSSKTMNLLKIKTKKYAAQEPVTMLDLNAISSAADQKVKSPDKKIGSVQSNKANDQDPVTPRSSRNKNLVQQQQKQQQQQEQEELAKATQQPQSRPPRAQNNNKNNKREHSRSKSRGAAGGRDKNDKEAKKKLKKSNKRHSSDKYSNDGFKHLQKEQMELAKKNDASQEGMIESQYDHEKQMRLFNDTMSALALNAYEIKEVNEKIGEQLDFRNKKLDRMENMSKNIENSLTNMEMMINKIMESI